MSILVCTLLRCDIYRRFFLMGNMTRTKWCMGLVCVFFFFLLTFFFYHFSCNLSTTFFFCFVFFWLCSLYLSLYIWKKLSVPTSVNVFSLVRTKAAEPGVVPVCVCVRRECVRMFLWALLPSLSAAAGPGKPGSSTGYISLQIFISSLQERVAWSRSWQFDRGEGCNRCSCSAFVSWPVLLPASRAVMG